MLGAASGRSAACMHPASGWQQRRAIITLRMVFESDSQMFYDASAFDQNIGGWNVASVSDMSRVCTCLPVAAMVRRVCLRM